MFNRRLFLKGAGGLVLGSTGLATYAFGVEPGLRLGVTRYKISPANWPANLNLKIAIVADIHACEPWMPVSRIHEIASVTNALSPDLIILLGDFNGGHTIVSRPVFPHQWAEPLSTLRAPLGIHAVLGNHDWWHGALPNMRPDGAKAVRAALLSIGASVLENDAIRLEHQGQPFWLLGLGDQIAKVISRGNFTGYDDLTGTIAQIKDDAPAILVAHEPYIFPRVPDRIALTLCGHTHGGQVSFPFVGPILANKRYGADLVYGHMVHGDRHLVISAGLGTSIAPVRFMRPPEIVEVIVGGPPALSV